MAREQVGAPGTVALFDTSDADVRFLVREKRINGEPDPEATLVTITPAILGTLTAIPEALLIDSDTTSVEVVTFEVFGQIIAWLKCTHQEGAFAGNDIDIHGPFLVDSSPSSEDLEITPGSIRVVRNETRSMTITYRDKENEGHRDPEAVSVTITPESLQTYRVVQQSIIDRVRAHDDSDVDWYTFDVFGEVVAFRKDRIHEDFAHGWIESYSGPFRVDTTS